jgi:hypothetical protein
MKNCKTKNCKTTMSGGHNLPDYCPECQDKRERSAASGYVQRLVVWLLGSDTYTPDGQHIAHRPSLWQRWMVPRAKLNIGTITLRYKLEETDNAEGQGCRASRHALDPLVGSSVGGDK